MAEQILSSSNVTEEDLGTVVETLKKLPQAPFLEISRIHEWCKSIYEKNENPLWHAPRLNGFGASETGSLIADLRNRNRKPGDEFITTFKSGRDVVADKLLYSVSNSSETAPTSRGKRLEGMIEELLIQQLRDAGHKVERADDVIAALKDTSGHHSKYKWLKGKNIDLPLYVNGELWLFDIKAPSTEALPQVVADEGGLAYQVQLNQYDMYAEDHGMEFKHLALAVFDYYNASVQIIEVEKDAELREEIINAGEYFWTNYVEKGRLPTIETRVHESIDPNSIPEEVNQAAYEYAFYRALSEASTALYKQKQSQLERTFRDNGYSPNKTVSYDFGFFNASTQKKEKLNQQAIEEAVERHQIDPGTCSVKGKFSHKKALTALKKLAAGGTAVDLDKLVALESDVSIRKAHHSKEIHRGLVERLENEAQNRAQQQYADFHEKTYGKVSSIIRDVASEQAQKIEAFRRADKVFQKSDEIKELEPLMLMPANLTREHEPAPANSEQSTRGLNKQHAQAPTQEGMLIEGQSLLHGESEPEKAASSEAVTAEPEHEEDAATEQEIDIEEFSGGMEFNFS